MSDQPKISFASVKTPEKGVLVVFAGEGPNLDATAKELDARSGGMLTKAAKATGFKGKRKAVLDLLMPKDLGLSRLLVVGTGRTAKMTANDWITLGGTVRGRLSGREGNAAAIIVDGLETGDASLPECAANLGYGIGLRSYTFEKYKVKSRSSDDDDDTANKLRTIKIMCEDAKKAEKAFERHDALIAGIFLARDLVNEPPNVLGPVEFAERTQALSEVGVKVEILDAKAMTKLGMSALLAVGQGSSRPSQLAVMTWNGGGKDEAPVAFVGKGVVFDTGGISIKPSAGMDTMKGDMAGAACVTGLMHALAARKAKVNAVGVIGIVENMPDGNAYRPGDVLSAMSGHTIEVLNTDAEGRLVLADALWYTQDRFKPKFVVNLATLTGAIMVALGKEHAGLFSNNDELSTRLSAAGEATGETVWRMPLSAKYDKMLDSKVADVKNIGGRWAGAVTAAQFLQRFIKSGTAWAHLDIAGTGMDAEKSDINTSWGPGFGVRLLDRLVADHYEGKS